MKRPPKDVIESARTIGRRALVVGGAQLAIVGALGYFLDAPGVTGQLICADGGQHLAWETPDVLGVE